MDPIEFRMQPPKSVLRRAIFVRTLHAWSMYFLAIALCYGGWVLFEVFYGEWWLSEVWRLLLVPALIIGTGLLWPYGYAVHAAQKSACSLATARFRLTPEGLEYVDERLDMRIHWGAFAHVYRKRDTIVVCDQRGQLLVLLFKQHLVGITPEQLESYIATHAAGSHEAGPPG
jgi:hypothetical protein